jgi:citrate lyase subunit beta/citryl-CoA lyase
VRLRSLLFVPGDRPERMAKALGLGADALILDLEDSVAPERKGEARRAVAEFLAAPREEDLPAVFVRVNPIDTDDAAADLAALAGLSPEGIVLPKAEGEESVRHLLDRHPGDYRVLPVASETPAAVFRLGTFAPVATRLAGVTWGAEDLPAAIGATTSREADGSYTDPYKVVRALTLFGAHAAGVPAIETVYPDFRDLDGLSAYAARGRRDGFSGMMAIHPSQVPVINAAFSPSDAELEHARRVVALFEANTGAGALQLDGRMVDAPHLKAARRLLGAESGAS